MSMTAIMARLVGRKPTPEPTPAPEPVAAPTVERETLTVSDDAITATLARVKRAGGRVVSSAPVSRGYVVTVEW